MGQIDNQDQLKVLMQIYSDLRKEILEAIKLQHRTIIAESFFVSIVFAIGLLQSGAQYFYQAMIISIIPFVIGFTSVWLIEQSRMMRAGDYLEFLEDKINILLDCSCCLTWENWLRRKEIKRTDVHRIHHLSQIVVIILFIIIGFFSIFLLWGLQEIDINFRHIMCSFYFVLMLILVYIVYKVVIHRDEPANKDMYFKWENDTYLIDLHKAKKQYNLCRNDEIERNER